MSQEQSASSPRRLQSAVRIKNFAEEQIQIVRGQSQFAENGCGRAVDVCFLEPFGGATKSRAQRDVLIFLAELAQELADSFRTSARFLNLPKRGGNFDFALFDILQQSAIERATVFGTVRINPAMTSIKRGAWLGEFPLSRRAFFRLILAKSRERQAERLELFRVVAALQLHVRENHAIAAKPAGEAKFFCD